MLLGVLEQGCYFYFPSSVGRIPWEILPLALGEGAVWVTGF